MFFLLFNLKLGTLFIVKDEVLGNGCRRGRANARKSELEDLGRRSRAPSRRGVGGFSGSHGDPNLLIQSARWFAGVSKTRWVGGVSGAHS